MVGEAGPAVSVLMTTWNGAEFIGASIASVLAQTFADFELIVVDDGSTDGTPRVLAEIGDERLRVLRQALNRGVVAARNVGFLAARGRYVAALDHDDLSHPERLARQVAYLDAHPRVALVATEVEIEAGARRGIGAAKGLPLFLRRPAGKRGFAGQNSDASAARRRHAPDHPTGGNPGLIRWLLHVDNPLTWSSVMFRADAVRRLGAFMRLDYELADDFDLYHRLLALGDIARLDEVLTVYRWHGSNTTYGREDALNANAVKVLAAAYAPLLKGDATDAATLVIRHLSDRRPVHDRATLERLGGYLSRLLAAFCVLQEVAAPQRADIEAATVGIWWRTARAAIRSGAPGLLQAYRAQSFLTAGFRPPRIDEAISTVVGLLRRRSYRLRSRVRTDS